MRALLIHVSDINVKTNSDTHGCWITGSTLLAGNKLVLADYINNKMKLLNLQTLEVTSELKTSSFPWDTTRLTSDQVAVTLKDSNTILFVSVTDTLKVDREMPVAGVCYGIVQNNGKLIVSFSNPVKIEIMTLDGTVERKIEQPSLFVWESSMALGLDCKTIYVADSNGGFVKGITLDGDVRAIYSDKKLNGPGGLIVDRQGRVLVCGQGSHNIHLLTPDLTKIKLLVDKLDYPKSLSYCHSTGRLFVGTLSDNVKVYQLS